MTEHISVDGRFETEPYKVVWKWKIPLMAAPQQIMVPTGARLLHAEYVSELGDYHFELWYECDLKNRDKPIAHVFQIFGTGAEVIPKMAKHVHSGIEWYEDHRNRRTSPQYVWHLFEYPTGARIVDI